MKSLRTWHAVFQMIQIAIVIENCQTTQIQSMACQILQIRKNTKMIMPQDFPSKLPSKSARGQYLSQHQ